MSERQIKGQFHDKIIRILQHCNPRINGPQRYSFRGQTVQDYQQYHKDPPSKRRLSILSHSSIQQMNRNYSLQAKRSMSRRESKQLQTNKSSQNKFKIDQSQKQIKFPSLFAKYKANYNPRNASLSQKSCYDLTQKKNSQRSTLQISNQHNSMSYIDIVREKIKKEENNKLCVLKRIFIQKNKKQKKIFYQKVKANKFKKLLKLYTE